MLLLSLECSTLPLIRTLYCWVLSEVLSSTIFKVFGMMRPGIEPMSPPKLVNSRDTRPLSFIHTHTSAQTHTLIETYWYIYLKERFLHSFLGIHIYIIIDLLTIHTYIYMNDGIQGLYISNIYNIIYPISNYQCLSFIVKLEVIKLMWKCKSCLIIVGFDETII